MLLGTSWASALVVMEGLGPFDSPYAPASVNLATQLATADFGEHQQALMRFVAHIPPNQAADVFETSLIAGPYILATGREFLPVGGYSGLVPAPTLAQFRHDVDLGRVHQVTVATSPLSSNPIMRWVHGHCQKTKYGYRDPESSTYFSVYACARPARAAQRP
jgi:hypothetical protein